LREFLSQIDHTVFHFFNTTIKNPFFDFLMPFITNEKIWILPIIAACVAVLVFGKPRQRMCVALGLIACAIVDPVAGHIIKPFFHRLRPCDTVLGANVLANAAGWSFPSNHAANTFAIATVIFYFTRKWGIIVFVTSFFVGIYRTSCGVHYPLDVLTGWLFGTAVSSAVLFAFSRTKWDKKTK
jgi:undecaprenyl-diphosphatase